MKLKLPILLSLIISILLFSCSSSGRFGLSQKYILEKGENIRPLEKSVVDKYEKIINIDTLNVPLNKFVLSKEYKVYIGVSFFANTNDLYQKYNNDSLYYFYKKKIEKDKIAVFFKKYDNYYYSYIYDSGKDKYTYILTLESDSATVYNKFKNGFLDTKIKHD